MSVDYFCMHAYLHTVSLMVSNKGISQNKLYLTYTLLTDLQRNVFLLVYETIFTACIRSYHLLHEFVCMSNILEELLFWITYSVDITLNMIVT